MSMLDNLPRAARNRWRIGFCILVGVIIGVTQDAPSSVWAAPTEAGNIQPGVPRPIGGFGGDGDERDADLYPAIAYNATQDIFLVVWMSLTNATGSGSGFDIYGRFLDRRGLPLGGPFRISDHNSVARSGMPTLVAAEDGFLVLWTQRGTPCRLMAQIVTDNRTRSDVVLNLDTQAHQHSPQLVYLEDMQRFVVAFVAGDDYLSPKYFGANVADCGDNPASTGQIRVAELSSHSDGSLQIERQAVISEAAHGAFRPSLAYHPLSSRYLVTWEDRRAGAGDPYRFDVYAQRLGSDLSNLGNNQLLSFGMYENSDTSATWTPRPVVVDDSAGFIVTSFQAERLGGSTTWSIVGHRITLQGQLISVGRVSIVTITSPPNGNAPTGFMNITQDQVTNHYLVVVSSHIESLFGYYSSLRMQRFAEDGTLLTLQGQPQVSAGTGVALDPVLDDQIMVSMAQRSLSPLYSEHLLVYARHALESHSQDYDIWSVRLVSSSLDKDAYLPILRWNR